MRLTINIFGWAIDLAAEPDREEPEQIVQSGGGSYEFGFQGEDVEARRRRGQRKEKP